MSAEWASRKGLFDKAVTSELLEVLEEPRERWQRESKGQRNVGGLMRPVLINQVKEFSFYSN